MSQYVTICHNMSQYVTICHNMSQYVTICHNMSQYVTITFLSFLEIFRTPKSSDVRNIDTHRMESSEAWPAFGPVALWPHDFTEVAPVSRALLPRLGRILTDLDGSWQCGAWRLIASSLHMFTYIYHVLSYLKVTCISCFGMFWNESSFCRIVPKLSLHPGRGGIRPSPDLQLIVLGKDQCMKKAITLLSTYHNCCQP